MNAMNVCTKGFCSALLRCGEIKLIAEKREYAISDLIANIARTKRRAEQNPSVRNLVSPYRMCPASKFQLQRFRRS